MNTLRKLFQGRYGVDQSSLALLLIGVVLSLIASLAGTPLASLPYLLALVICLCRALSRNLYARSMENQRWLGAIRRIRERLGLWGRMLRECRTHRYLRCPACSQMLRVPKGKGTIEVHCSRCRHRFIKKV